MRPPGLAANIARHYRGEGADIFLKRDSGDRARIRSQSAVHQGDCNGPGSMLHASVQPLVGFAAAASVG